MRSFTRRCLFCHCSCLCQLTTSLRESFLNPSYSQITWNLVHPNLPVLLSNRFENYSAVEFCTKFQNYFMLYCNRFLEERRPFVVNILKPRQNGRHFPDDIFRSIFVNENACISNKMSLKFVSKGPINNIPALVEIMAWRPLANKPSSEPMMVSLLTHVDVTQPQWVNSNCSSHGIASVYQDKISMHYKKTNLGTWIILH